MSLSTAVQTSVSQIFTEGRRAGAQKLLVMNLFVL